MNGTYITESDILFIEAPPVLVKSADEKLLEDIARGEKVVLPFNDLRVSMKITPQECDLIRRYREGEISLIER